MSADNAAKAKALQQFGQPCPGLHGPGSRQAIRPMTFYELFTNEQIVIPLFQRAYCWGAGSTKHFSSHRDTSGTEVRLVEAWFRDLSKASTSRPHQVGKIVFTRDAKDGSLHCIDGQQRCTSTFLVLAALRDAALELLQEDPSHDQGAKLIAGLNLLLYKDEAAAEAWVQHSVEGGSLPHDSFDTLQSTGAAPFMRLLPSWVDRKNYYEATLGGLVRQACPGWQPSKDMEESHQGQAKIAFDSEVAASLARKATLQEKWMALKHLVENATLGMALMYVEILNEVNMAQVFVWMQDMSLMNVMFNPHPGIQLRGNDMIRNLVLSTYMQLPLDEQEAQYRQLWLEPIELCCDGIEVMDDVLERFLEAKTGLTIMATDDGGTVGRPEVGKKFRPPKRPMLPPTMENNADHDVGGSAVPRMAKKARHMCDTEVAIYAAARLFAAKLPTEVPKLKGAMMYSRFRSLTEEAEAKIGASQMGPPPAKKKEMILDACGNVIPDMNMAAPQKTAEDEQKERELAQAAHRQILQELAAFISNSL